MESNSIEIQSNEVQARDWFIEVYPEWSESFKDNVSLKEYIEKNVDYQNYAFIYHDKDFFEDSGEPKKEHFHICIKLTRSQRRSYLERRFKIPKNQPQFLQIAGSLNACLRYLVHKDHPLRYQYQVNEVITNIINFEQIIESGFNEIDQLYILLKQFKDFAKQQSKDLDIIYGFRDFVEYCAINHCLSLCVKYTYFIKSYLGV